MTPHNGGASIWDLRTRTRIGDQFPVSPGVIPAVTFTRAGRLLLTDAGSIIEWPTDRPTLQRAACRIVGRELTREEWADVLPRRRYRRVCAGGGGLR